MAKNISLSEEAYKKLSKEKIPNESFSGRLLGNKKNLSDVIGKNLIGPDISVEDIKKASRNTLDRIINEGPCPPTFLQELLF